MRCGPRCRARTVALGVLVAALGSACGEDDGEGTATFTTYGEDFIEKEIPAEEIEDGWSVTFERFLVVIGEVSVAEGGAAPAARMAGSKLFEMKRATGDKLVTRFERVPAKAYDRVSYAIAPAGASTELGDGASDADKQLMIAGGYSIYFEATATRGAASKRMAWGFTTSTLYDRCTSVESGKETDGIVVTNGGTANAQLTIHGDHFFYDDLQSESAKLRFDNLAAADANDDGTLTLEELGAVKLAALPAGSGPYGTGSAAGVHDLRAYVEALSRTLGHFRGEGECLSRAR